MRSAIFLMDQINDSQIRWFTCLLIVIFLFVMILLICLIVRNSKRDYPFISKSNKPPDWLPYGFYT